MEKKCPKGRKSHNAIFLNPKDKQFSLKEDREHMKNFKCLGSLKPSMMYFELQTSSSGFSQTCMHCLKRILPCVERVLCNRLRKALRTPFP
jgi:hypothetical protein